MRTISRHHRFGLFSDTVNMLHALSVPGYIYNRNNVLFCSSSSYLGNGLMAARLATLDAVGAEGTIVPVYEV